jgi:hypothetical protein
LETGFTHDLPDTSGHSLHPNRKTSPGNYKSGAACNRGKFANAAGVQCSGNCLIYGAANQALYRTESGSNRGLDVTRGFDWSPNDVIRENSQITAGARYNGPIPSQPQDSADLDLSIRTSAIHFKRSAFLRDCRLSARRKPSN